MSIVDATAPRTHTHAQTHAGAQAMTPVQRQSMDSETVTSAHLERLVREFGHLDGEALLDAMVHQAFPNKIAMVSSFGSEAVVLLHLLSRVNPTVPVLFLNTGKLFGETLRYRDRLQEKLGLTDVRSLGPDPRIEADLDPKGDLWARNPDQCCHFRKVLPLARGLEGFAASITGRKQFQTDARSAMPVIEQEKDATGAPGRFKINPLANWTLAELKSYIEDHRLPRHPLVDDGYLSIGCMPCTDRVKDGEDYRSGRWAGLDKDECGIHVPGLVDGDGI